MNSDRSIRVLLPTAGRPDMLRTALASVAAQTARDSVVEVLVSENRGDPRSGEVAARFPGLPIRYVLNEPALAPLAHAKALFTRDTRAAYTAILHDDDWWSPRHLETALHAFERHPEAGLYGCGFYHVSGENSPLTMEPDLMMWFGAGMPAGAGPWKLSSAETLLASLPGTAIRYSTMVAPSRLIQKAAWVYDLENPFDNDRLLIRALTAGQGAVFNPCPEVFIRHHPGQDVETFRLEAIHRHMTGTTERLLTAAAETGLRVGEELAARFANCPAEHRAALVALFSYPWVFHPLSSRGLLPFAADQAPRPAAWRRLARELTPPALARLLHKWAAPRRASSPRG